MIARLVRFELAGPFLHRGKDAVGDRLGDREFVRAGMRCISGRRSGTRGFAFEFVEPMVHLLQGRENGGKFALAVLLREIGHITIFRWPRASPERLLRVRKILHAK